MKIEVLRVAQQEFEDAYAYYENEQPGLGEQFRDAIKALVLKIKDNPDAWLQIRPGIRRCPGTRFPYNLIYQKIPAGLLILAVSHQKRHPRHWLGRTRRTQG